jgi:hypothetical protein
MSALGLTPAAVEFAKHRYKLGPTLRRGTHTILRNPHIRAEANALLMGGKSYAEVAEILGVSVNVLIKNRHSIL